MKIKLDLVVRCPHCGNGTVSWQLSKDMERNVLQADTLCKTCGFGRQELEYYDIKEE